MLRKRTQDQYVDVMNKAESFNKLKELSNKDDGKLMFKEMKAHFAYFDIMNVNELKNFSQPLKKHGFKKVDDLKKFITEFIEHMKNTKKVEIILLKKREFKKANQSILNILINRLALEYPDDLLSFLNRYENNQDLKSEFETSINCLKIESSVNKISNELFNQFITNNDDFNDVSDIMNDQNEDGCNYDEHLPGFN